MPTLRPGTLPAIMLVVVIAWALAAVYLLSRTLIAAHDIDNRVAVINGELAPINQDLDAVRLADATAEISGNIREQTDTLSSLLKGTVNSVKSINSSADSILASAREINTKAHSINETAASINTNVHSIGSRLSAIGADVASIHGSVESIGASFVGILDEVQSIDPGAAGINRRANTVLGLGEGIRDDLDRVRALVVDINTNAHEISGSPILLERPAPDVVNTIKGLLVELTGGDASTASLPPSTGNLPTGQVTKPPSPLSLPSLPSRPSDLAGLLGLTGASSDAGGRGVLGLLGGPSQDAGGGLLGSLGGGGGLW